MAYLSRHKWRHESLSTPLISLGTPFTLECRPTYQLQLAVSCLSHPNTFYHHLCEGTISNGGSLPGLTYQFPEPINRSGVHSPTVQRSATPHKKSASLYRASSALAIPVLFVAFLLMFISDAGFRALGDKSSCRALRLARQYVGLGKCGLFGRWSCLLDTR